MGLFGEDMKKVKAAAGSMHQFMSTMRGLFPADVEDWYVECTVIFAYRRVLHEVFGHRFVEKWDGVIRDRLKYATVPELNAQILKLATLADEFEASEDLMLPEGATISEYEHRVRSMIRAIFTGAGCGGDDPELIRASFAPFEELLQRIAAHLTGIKKQNAFVMK